jgi:ATP-binding cassette subfamily B protein
MTGTPSVELLRWYYDLWRPFRGRLLLLVALAFLMGSVRTLFPAIFKPLLDRTLSEGAVPLELLLALGSVGVLRALLLTVLFSVRASNNLLLSRRARERAFERVIALGPDFLARHATGDLLARLTDDCSEEKMAFFACSGVFRALEASWVIASSLAVLISISPRLTLICFMPIPAISIIYRVLRRRLDPLLSSVQRSLSSATAMLDGLFTTTRVVKANVLEERETERFASLATRLGDEQVRAINGQEAVEMLYGYGWQIVIPILVFRGGSELGTHGLSMGGFTAFYSALLLLASPALDIGEFFVRLTRAGTSVARLREIEREQPEVATSRAGQAVVLGSRIAFEGVSRLSPDRRRALLVSVTLEVKRGSTVALIGPVGSGKSTILRLLPRIMDPSSGRILVDAQDLRVLDLHAWRRLIGYVPQDPTLFSATVEENIRLGRVEYSHERLLAACEAAQLSKDLSLLPEGLRTVVGERGQTLSGGQRQRVAIARALLHDPEVLIFDDASAALDAKTEEQLWQALGVLRPTLTKILVTHRRGTIESADNVVLFDRGHVVDQGAPKELLERCALYRDLLLEGQRGVSATASSAESLPPS